VAVIGGAAAPRRLLAGPGSTLGLSARVCAGISMALEKLNPPT